MERRNNSNAPQIPGIGGFTGTAFIDQLDRQFASNVGETRELKNAARLYLEEAVEPRLLRQIDRAFEDHKKAYLLNAERPTRFSTIKSNKTNSELVRLAELAFNDSGQKRLVKEAIIVYYGPISNQTIFGQPVQDLPPNFE